MKKIFFCDLDGTLAQTRDNQDYVLDRDKRAIEAFIDQSSDNEFVLATGRALDNIEAFQNKFKIECKYIISENGACIWGDGKLLHSQKMDLKIGHDLLEELLKTKAYIMYSNGRRQTYQDEEGHILTGDESVDLVADLFDHALNTDQIVKITAFIPRTSKNYNEFHANFAAMEKLLNDKFGHHLDIMDTSTIHADVFDIQVKNVSKGDAIKWIFDNLEVDFHKTYAVGDAINDYRMFEVVDKGFKMKLGNPKLEEVMYAEVEHVHNALAHAIKE